MSDKKGWNSVAALELQQITDGTDNSFHKQIVKGYTRVLPCCQTAKFHNYQNVCLEKDSCKSVLATGSWRNDVVSSGVTQTSPIQPSSTSSRPKFPITMTVIDVNLINKQSIPNMRHDLTPNTTGRIAINYGKHVRKLLKGPS